MSSTRPEHARPMDLADLREAVAALAAIDHAGNLAALKAELTAADAWPVPLERELQQCTAGAAIYIPMLAREAGNILGVAYGDCLEAAADAVLTTRRQRALGIIQTYAKELRGQHGR
jgi:hypothetical protein